MLDFNKHAHSHDSLQIVQRDCRYCVCKTCGTDLVRAQRNVDKQRKFQSLYTGTVRVSSAEVLNFQVYSDCAELQILSTWFTEPNESLPVYRDFR